MRKHIRHVTAVAATTALALTLLGALAIVFGQITPAPTAQAAPDVRAPDPSVLARRAISIPFGIASPLTITQDGGQIMATGHGVCWEDGQMFDLHVRVAQSTTHAFAEGHTIDICADGARQMWQAPAPSGSDAAFAAGTARACAEAIEFGKHGIADEHRWCKDIELAVGE